MKQVLIRKGKAILEEVPTPLVGAKNILVQVQYSCISAGTERSTVSLTAMPLYQRALKQPHHVRRVLAMVKEQGFQVTKAKVQAKLGFGTPTGYSAAGVVIAVGALVTEFQIGQKVACAGSNHAHHAEFIDVPVNLAVPIPDAVDMQTASTVTLGAIALQGVRQAEVTLGEVVVVIGLGIIGQLTAKILQASACQVIAVDIDDERIALAQKEGIQAFNTTEHALEKVVEQLSAGFGADAVIITAASSRHDIVREAMRICRKKGRVVVVGDVGLHLEREAFYQKEIDLRMSCSYGPGRYDATYEQEGQDYPIAYVRWTENRNMRAYVALVAAGKVVLKGLPCKVYAQTEAGQAYEALHAGRACLLNFFRYNETVPTSKIENPQASAVSLDKIQVGIVGAGGFVQGVLLPLLAGNSALQIRAVMSRTGVPAKKIALQYGCSYVTSNFQELIADKEIQLILIASTHHVHAEQTLAALQAGKHVFVEKPLAISWEQVFTLEKWMQKATTAPCVMTGFNRRFSPIIQHFKSVLNLRLGPMMLHYRVNAGSIAKDHWIQGLEGGGRNLGEACHFYDLFNFLTGAAVLEVFATGTASDNFTATIRYQDGSVCTLLYTAEGDGRVSKESMEIFCDGKVFMLNDYKSYEIFSKKKEKKQYSFMNKGHAEEWKALVHTLQTAGAWPISWQEQLMATKIALTVEDQLKAPHVVEKAVCVE